MIGLGFGINSIRWSRGGGGTPTPTPTPTLVLTDALYDGDSRTASAGGYLSGFTLTSGMATPGFAGMIQALVGNKFHLTNGFQHGIGASTTLAMNGRRTTASQALTGNPAFATIPTAADNQLNSNSDGKYALADNPGKLVISASMGVNDNNIFFNDPAPAYGTIRQIAQYADALGAAGFKLYMGNEVAKGRSTYLMERRTVGVAGGFAADTCRVINTGNFLDGESYGAVGVVGQFTAGAPRPLTKVASAPGQDQYTVTSAGVFTFGGTAPITAFITYNANGTSGGSTEDGLRVIRNWCASSAPNFIAADSGAATGFNYAIPGLLFNRPHVRVADTFNALLDPASGAEQRALPGTFDQLQLHGYATGQWLAANAFKTLFDTDFPTAPRLDFQPTRNNWWAARANNATTVFSGTLPPTMRVVTPTLISINGAPIGRADTSTGVITGTGITSGSLNFATGDWTITFANAAAAGPLNAQIWFEQDIGNFDTATLTIGTISRNPVMNGLLDMTPAVGTNLSTFTGVSIVTGISGSQLPYGWSMQTGAGNTALNAAIAASTATVTVSVTVDGDGYNQLNLSVEGVHSAAVGPTVTSTINTPANRVRTTGGLFVGARLVYAPHPVIGRMYGTTGYTLSFTGSTSAVTRDTFEGRTTTVATVGARVTDVGLNIFMDDKFLATANGGTPGPFSLYRISGLLDLDGPSGSPAINWTTASLSFSCTTAINVPFAVRIGIGRVQCRAAPNSAAFAAAAAA